MAARPTANPSGALAVGTTTLFTGRFTLNSIMLLSDGTTACSVTIYDNTAASGKIMAVLAIPAPAIAATPQTATMSFSNAVKAEIGITVVVAGGTSTAYVNTGGA